MDRAIYSIRQGTNENKDGLPLEDIKGMFLKIYHQLYEDGYFHESFGFTCVDEGFQNGTVRDSDLDILLKVRKKELWPINQFLQYYSEDDLFDMIEYLFLNVSKPIDGHYHSWNDCGMHWETFNRNDGQTQFVAKINEILCHYTKAFELSPTGEMLQRPEHGFEPIFKADIPSKDTNVKSRIDSATMHFRRHGSTIDDRRQAVRDLADVLEYLRPKVKELITKNDEQDLFNIANNFGIGHHNESQKTNYDTSLWLSWMFYFYLSTIHVVLRKIDSLGTQENLERTT